MAKYRKKPVEIEAECWNGQNVVDIYNFLEGTNYQSEAEGVKSEGKNFYIKFDNGSCQLGSLIIKTLEGDMKANLGDYIIKGINGEFYPCKPDIFEKTYEYIQSNNAKSDWEELCDICSSLAEEAHITKEDTRRMLKEVRQKYNL